MLNDRDMKTLGLPRGVDVGRAFSHDRDEPERSRELQGGRARLWVQTVLHQSGPRGGGGAVGEW